MERLLRRWGSASLCLLVVSLPASAGLLDRYVVDVYVPDKVYAGTTIFGDESDPKSPLIVEVDMAGKVLWSYAVPSALGRSGGMDVEWIPASDHILFTRETGAYEVNRNQQIVWSHNGPSSHDADRLPNGNTLVVWGWGASSSDPEVREVSPQGEVVWKWHAEDHLKNERRIFHKEGLTHANSVVRLANGNTLVSLRNYYMLVEVAPSGEIVWKLPGLFTTPHDPEILANGNILVNTRGPQVIKEITPGGKVLWTYRPDQKEVNVVRYNHRLPNGNTLLVERIKIIEISPAKEIVWQLRMKNVSTSEADRSRWLYKAERIPAGRRAEPTHAYAAPSETLARSGEAVLSLEQQTQSQARQLANGMMRRMDSDGDGRIERSEFTGRGSFDSIDTNQDGFITIDEAIAFQSKRLARQGGDTARSRRQ
jgi:hypothetical protein